MTCEYCGAPIKVDNIQVVVFECGMKREQFYDGHRTEWDETEPCTNNMTSIFTKVEIDAGLIELQNLVSKTGYEAGYYIRVDEDVTDLWDMGEKELASELLQCELELWRDRATYIQG